MEAKIVVSSFGCLAAAGISIAGDLEKRGGCRAKGVAKKDKRERCTWCTACILEERWGARGAKEHCSPMGQTQIELHRWNAGGFECAFDVPWLPLLGLGSVGPLKALELGWHFQVHLGSHAVVAIPRAIHQPGAAAAHRHGASSAWLKGTVAVWPESHAVSPWVLPSRPSKQRLRLTDETWWNTLHNPNGSYMSSNGGKKCINFFKLPRPILFKSSMFVDFMQKTPSFGLFVRWSKLHVLSLAVGKP